MNWTRNELESALFDFDVWHLQAPWESASAADGCRERYELAKVPAENLETIQRLEGEGFRFLEFQFRAQGRLRRPYDTSAFPYDTAEITDAADLEAVLHMAGTIFQHDRFSTDPWLRARGGRRLSALRYQAYVRQSFDRPDEEVTALRARATGELVAFATHRLLPGGEALLLLGGVREDLNGNGLGAINDQIGLNHLFARGYRRWTTHFSGINYPILNLEVGGLGFKLRQAEVVLRRVPEDRRA